MGLDLRADALRRLVRHQAEVDRRARFRRDGVRGLRAHPTGKQAAHVERGQQDPLHEARATRLRAREGQLVAQRLVGVGHLAQRLLLRLRRRTDVVVEAGDLDAPIHVAQRGDEMCELHRGVGRPVAVVPAVQRTRGAEEGHLEVGDAARAEVDLHAPGLVHRAVAQEPGVPGDLVAIVPQEALEVRRARLLLAFQEERDVHRRGAPEGAQRVERGEQAHDGSLVVRGGPAEEARFRRIGRARERYLATAVGQRPVAQDRRPRIARPLRGIDGLAVVVRVEHDRAPRSRDFQLAVHGGRRALDLEQPRGETAASQHPDEVIGVGADGRGVAREVREGHEVGQLAHDLRLVRLPPRAHLGRRRSAPRSPRARPRPASRSSPPPHASSALLPRAHTLSSA